MAKLLKLRRGTTTQHNSFTGAEGECTVDMDKDVLVVHDGSTAGGHPVAAEDMANVSSANIVGRIGTAALAGTKVSPDFGSQNVTTTGTLSTGAITASQTVNVEGTSPTLNLTDSNANSDFRLNVDGGLFQIRDVTNDAYRLKIASDGTVDIGQNLNANGGLDVSGALTGSGQFTLNTTANQKIVLQGSSNPYIRFLEGSTNKAYIQWESSGNELILVNEETSDYLRIGSSNTGLRWHADGTTSTVWTAGNDGSGSGLDADLLDGVHGGSFVRSDASDTLTGAQYTLSSSTDQKLILQGSSDPYIHFREGTTDKAYIQFHSNGNFYFVNQESGEQLLIGSGEDGLKYHVNGTTRTVITTGNLANQNSTINSALNCQNITCAGLDAGNSVIRTDSWFYNDTSGNGLYNSATSQHFYSDEDDYWNIAGGSAANGLRFRDEHGGTIRGYVYANNANQIGFLDQGGSWSLRTERDASTCTLFDQHFVSDTNGSYDLGSSSARWRNLYVNDLQLSNEHSGGNSVDGTWGDWTLQEAEDTVYMLNNRNGKKYKMALQEVA